MVVEALLADFVVHLLTESENTLGVSVSEVACVLIAKKFDDLVETHFEIF